MNFFHGPPGCNYSWYVTKGFEHHRYFLGIDISLDISVSKLMFVRMWKGYESRENNEQNKGTFLEQAVKGSEILSVSCFAF